MSLSISADKTAVDVTAAAAAAAPCTGVSSVFKTTAHAGCDHMYICVRGGDNKAPCDHRELSEELVTGV